MWFSCHVKEKRGRSPASDITEVLGYAAADFDIYERLNEKSKYVFFILIMTQ